MRPRITLLQRPDILLLYPRALPRRGLLRFAAGGIAIVVIKALVLVLVLVLVFINIKICNYIVRLDDAALRRRGIVDGGCNYWRCIIGAAIPAAAAGVVRDIALFAWACKERARRPLPLSSLLLLRSLGLLILFLRRIRPRLLLRLSLLCWRASLFPFVVWIVLPALGPSPCWARHRVEAEVGEVNADGEADPRTIEEEIIGGQE